MVGIAGPNGAGKTSLLRAIGGLAPLRRGRITFEGRILREGGSTKVATRSNVRAGVVLVPEGRRLFAGLTVEDNLRFGAYLVGSSDVVTDLARIYSIFPKLAERRLQDVNTLSGGEKQMVAIGRGLMARPKLLMIDEMSLGLAPIVVHELLEALGQLNLETGLTFILVDEGLARLGPKVSRVVFLSRGRIQAVLSPAELQEGAANLYLSDQVD
ncbi:MAG: ATP-binding cassette domain-containing protein [Alphaproteobacteria bacterium]|nr:ATP-binding cassette domain-containing protein [Alphaproteobacteria bacterium]